MVDVITLLRRHDPAAHAPAVADPAGIRTRIALEPRSGTRPARRRASSKRRFIVAFALAVLALGGTAVADRLLTASDVFSSPDAVGQGDSNAPVHPVAGSERAVQSVSVPGIGSVQLWAAEGSSVTGACLGLRFPDGTWGAGNERSGGNGPACFTERDDAMFEGTLIATGIDALETDVDAPFNRIVYGIIDSDRPATAVRIVDRVTGTTTAVVDGRYFAYLDPRADRQRDDHTLVAYDAAGAIVASEVVAPGSGTAPADDPNAPPAQG
ncbi:MAG TPA: hypothetical protein VGK92_15145 [Gaiellales bacterium]|jgi:hypothetical protein